MRNKMKYETPEIEVTRFEANKEVMVEKATGEGDIVTFDPGTNPASEVEITNDVPFD